MHTFATAFLFVCFTSPLGKLKKKATSVELHGLWVTLMVEDVSKWSACACFSPPRLVNVSRPGLCPTETVGDVWERDFGSGSQTKEHRGHPIFSPILFKFIAMKPFSTSLGGKINKQTNNPTKEKHLMTSNQLIRSSCYGDWFHISLY